MSLYDEMLAAADPSQVPGLSRFFKCGPGQYGQGDKFLGIKVPVTRAIVTRCWREAMPKCWTGDVPVDKREVVAKDCSKAAPVRWREAGFGELERCICSEYHEVRLAALLTLVEIFRHADRISAKNADGTRADDSDGTRAAFLRQRCIDFYLAHTAYINNWDLVDLSCYPLLGQWLLDKQDRSLLYDLARNGKTIWEQRIGIVSTMTFIRHGQLQDTFAIADILLHHPHDLIHKAVGWLLREAGKRDKPALEAFLAGPDPSDHLAGPDPSDHLADLDPSDHLADPDPSDHLAGLDSSDPPASQNLYDHFAGPDPSDSPIAPSGGSGTVESSPRYLQMPRTMLRYAIEKFPEPERQLYLKGSSRQ